MDDKHDSRQTTSQIGIYYTEGQTQREIQRDTDRGVLMMDIRQTILKRQWKF